MLHVVAKFARASSSASSSAAAAFAAQVNEVSFEKPVVAFYTPRSPSLKHQQQQRAQQQQFSSRAGSDDSSNPFSSSSSSSPEAATSKGDPSTNEVGSSSEPGHTTFTGTADVFTPNSGNAQQQQQQQASVATDANRSWMSGDDLGTRVEAVTSNNEGSTPTASPGSSADRQQQNRPDDANKGATLGVDAASPECHPADPYCQAGEEAPMPDGFHEPEPGDDHIPPSSGFPA
jgi:hypothetical protein